MKSGEMILQAISRIGKAKVLSFSSKQEALIELEKASDLMHQAILLNPDSIDNRCYRMRHLLGVSMNSPKNYLNYVLDDFNFFEERFDSLDRRYQADYLSARGEYEVFIDNRDEGIKMLEMVLTDYYETEIVNYTKIVLEGIKNNEG